MNNLIRKEYIEKLKLNNLIKLETNFTTYSKEVSIPIMKKEKTDNNEWRVFYRGYYGIQYNSFSGRMFICL